MTDDVQELLDNLDEYMKKVRQSYNGQSSCSNQEEKDCEAEKARQVGSSCYNQGADNSCLQNGENDFGSAERVSNGRDDCLEAGQPVSQKDTQIIGQRQVTPSDLNYRADNVVPFSTPLQISGPLSKSNSNMMYITPEPERSVYPSQSVPMSISDGSRHLEMDRSCSRNTEYELEKRSNVQVNRLRIEEDDASIGRKFDNFVYNLLKNSPRKRSIKRKMMNGSDSLADVENEREAEWDFRVKNRKCELCNIIFSSETKFQSHMSAVHGKRLLDIGVTKCDLCNITFYSAWTYKNHVSNTHVKKLPVSKRHLKNRNCSNILQSYNVTSSISKRSSDCHILDSDVNMNDPQKCSTGLQMQIPEKSFTTEKYGMENTCMKTTQNLTHSVESIENQDSPTQANEKSVTESLKKPSILLSDNAQSIAAGFYHSSFGKRDGIMKDHRSESPVSNTKNTSNKLNETQTSVDTQESNFEQPLKGIEELEDAKALNHEAGVAVRASCQMLNVENKEDCHGKNQDFNLDEESQTTVSSCTDATLGSEIDSNSCSAFDDIMTEMVHRSTCMRTMSFQEHMDAIYTNGAKVMCVQEKLRMLNEGKGLTFGIQYCPEKFYNGNELGRNLSDSETPQCSDHLKKKMRLNYGTGEKEIDRSVKLEVRSDSENTSSSGMNTYDEDSKQSDTCSMSMSDHDSLNYQGKNNKTAYERKLNGRVLENSFPKTGSGWNNDLEVTIGKELLNDGHDSIFSDSGNIISTSENDTHKEMFIQEKNDKLMVPRWQRTDCKKETEMFNHISQTANKSGMGEGCYIPYDTRETRNNFNVQRSTHLTPVTVDNGWGNNDILGIKSIDEGSSCVKKWTSFDVSEDDDVEKHIDKNSTSNIINNLVSGLISTNNESEVNICSTEYSGVRNCSHSTRMPEREHSSFNSVSETAIKQDSVSTSEFSIDESGVDLVVTPDRSPGCARASSYQTHMQKCKTKAVNFENVDTYSEGTSNKASDGKVEAFSEGIYENVSTTRNDSVDGNHEIRSNLCNIVNGSLGVCSNSRAMYGNIFTNNQIGNSRGESPEGLLNVDNSPSIQTKVKEDEVYRKRKNNAIKREHTFLSPPKKRWKEFDWKEFDGYEEEQVSGAQTIGNQTKAENHSRTDIGYDSCGIQDISYDRKTYLSENFECEGNARGDRTANYTGLIMDTLSPYYLGQLSHLDSETPVKRDHVTRRSNQNRPIGDVGEDMYAKSTFGEQYSCARHLPFGDIAVTLKRNKSDGAKT